jgi:hypothetical protein
MIRIPPASTSRFGSVAELPALDCDEAFGSPSDIQSTAH